MSAIFLQAANTNLLLGSIPESFGLLIFGSLLIASAVGLRWALNRQTKVKAEKFSTNIHVTTSEV